VTLRTFFIYLPNDVGTAESVALALCTNRHLEMFAMGHNVEGSLSNVKNILLGDMNKNQTLRFFAGYDAWDLYQNNAKNKLRQQSFSAIATLNYWLKNVRAKLNLMKTDGRAYFRVIGDICKLADFCTLMY
jgi:hypothetical protein